MTPSRERVLVGDRELPVTEFAAALTSLPQWTQAVSGWLDGVQDAPVRHCRR